MCPRCEHEDVRQLAVSQVAGAWEVLRCSRCLYTWRTTEPARRTQRAAYPGAFRMSRADIEAPPELPPVPPLSRIEA